MNFHKVNITMYFVSDPPFRKQILLQYKLFSILLFSLEMRIQDVPCPYSTSEAAPFFVQLHRMAI